MQHARPVPEPSDPPVTVLVADDDPLARRLVVQTLRDAGLDVIAEATTADEAVSVAVQLRPAVVVLDLIMPGGDCVGAIRRLCASGGDTAILALSSTADDELGVESLRAGADGYLPKEVGLEPLPRAVRAVAEGEAIIPRRLGRLVLERLRVGHADRIGLRPVRSPLTPREWEVFDLLCAGHTTDEIATCLVLSHETVRSHVKRILRKLQVRTRAEAVARGPALRAVG